MGKTLTQEKANRLKGGHITIPDGCTKIGKYAFHRRSDMSSIAIPNSMKTICTGAFDQSSVEEVIIPASVKTISEGAFTCENLREICVADNNKAYSNLKHRDGVLYNKDKTVLLAYPAADIRESYTIPNSVKKIGYMAFIWAKNLRTITIPDSVTEIGEGAFFGCSFDEVKISPNNPAHSSECGSLYNKDKTELLEIPYGYSGVFIPKSVTNINPMVFQNVQLNFYIVCYKDSYAHKFAAAEGHHYVLIGERHDTHISEFCKEMGR